MLDRDVTYTILLSLVHDFFSLKWRRIGNGLLRSLDSILFVRSMILWSWEMSDSACWFLCSLLIRWTTSALEIRWSGFNIASMLLKRRWWHLAILSFAARLVLRLALSFFMLRSTIRFNKILRSDDLLITEWYLELFNISIAHTTKCAQSLE